MMNKTSTLLLSLIYLCCLSCSTRTADSPEAPVARLDLLLADFGSLDYSRQVEAIEEFRPELAAMFAVLGAGDISTQTLDDWSRSKAVEVFQPDVDSVYSDTSRLGAEIGSILAAARRDSLGLPDGLRFATVTWGNPRPIVRVDSVVLIALNHFLGADYQGYAQWPEFRRTEKTPAQLPYSIAAVLAATQYPMRETQGTTLLSWMLYEGALTEAKMRLVDGARLDEALGYTPEQLKYVQDNTEALWQELAIKKLIYDTDPAVTQRYIGPAPSTPLLQGNAPGRVARYIGYRIVRAYIDRHRDVSLRQLLSPEFYDSQQTLIDSGFTGR